MSTEQNPVMVAVGRVAAANRKVNVKPGALEAARRDLQVERLKRAILREIDPTEAGYVSLPVDERRELANMLMAGTGYRVRKS